jgi:hypothetical protein
MARTPAVMIVAALVAAWQLADALAPTAVLLAVATLAVAGLVALVARRPATVTGAGGPAHALALRERASRTTFLRLRDPDAAGRPRPRAPSAGPRAAAGSVRSPM